MCVVVDPDKEDAGQGSTSEGKDPTSNGGSLRGKTFNVPEIEFHEYKVHSHSLLHAAQYDIVHTLLHKTKFEFTC